MYYSDYPMPICICLILLHINNSITNYCQLAISQANCKQGELCILEDWGILVSESDTDWVLFQAITKDNPEGSKNNLHGSSVSNGSGYPACSQILNHKNGLVWFQTCPKFWPTDSWRVKHSPIPVNLRISPGLARTVASNPQFSISGFTIIVPFIYANVNWKILPMVGHGVFSTCWPP